VGVQHVHDNARWKIPYHFLNIEQKDIDITCQPKEKLTKNHLKIGDFVGFNHDGQPVSGMVIRLNYKTASILAVDSRRWRVSYGCLYKVIDADLADKFNPHMLHLKNSEMLDIF
jgi:hypothetical protein